MRTLVLIGCALLVVALLCAGLALVLVVMRSLLVQASAFRAELDEVICSIPAIVDNCRSIGVATELAIAPGLAPGRLALIWMVGKSTCGSAATGSSR